MLRKGNFCMAGLGLFLCAAMMAAGATGAWAKGETQNAPSHKLGEVTVEARQIEERLSAELSEFGHQVQVIKGDDIYKAGFADLYQALEALVPGLFISLKNGRGDYAAQYLHGSNTILWLIDGVRINNRLYGRGYLDTIGVRMIDRVEVLYGGEGLFYGTESTGGVVNIITKSVTAETSGEVGVGYGSYQAREVFGHVTGTFAGNGVMVFGSYDSWDGFQPFDDKTYAKYDNPDHPSREYNRNNLGVKYRREFNFLGKGVLKAHFQRNKGEFDYVRPNEQKALNDRTQDLMIMKWDHDVNSSFSYYIKTFLHRWWTDYTRRRLDGSYVYNKALWGFQDWGVNALASYRFGGGHEVLMGLDYQNYYGDDEVTDIYTDHEEVKAVFAQYRPRFGFFPKLKTAFGVRYNQTGDTDKTVWSASARCPIVHGAYARANVGTSFILPTAEQLWQNDQESQEFGNPDLKPQESFNIDVGLGGKWRLFNAEVGYFRQDITDRIVFENTTYKNVDKEVNIDGFELQAGLGPFHGFSLVGSYTYTRVEQEDSGKQTAGIPEYFYKVNLQWRHLLESCGLGADLMTRYVGNMENYSTDYGDYWVADVSGFVTFGKDMRHRITVRLENIFDEDYASRLYRGTDTDGNRFVYEAKGIPFNVYTSYSYSF